jgi:hypothetical protein
MLGLMVVMGVLVDIKEVLVPLDKVAQIPQQKVLVFLVVVRQAQQGTT